MLGEVYALLFVLVPSVALAQQPVPGDVCLLRKDGGPTAPGDATDPFESIGETAERGDEDPFAPSCIGDPAPTIRLTLVPRVEHDPETETLIANLLLINDTGADVLVHADTYLDWTLHREVAPGVFGEEMDGTGSVATRPRQFLLLRPRALEQKQRGLCIAANRMVVRHAIGPETDFPITMRGTFDFSLSGQAAVWEPKASRLDIREFIAEASFTLPEKEKSKEAPTSKRSSGLPRPVPDGP